MLKTIWKKKLIQFRMYQFKKYTNKNLLDLFKWRNDKSYRKFSFNKKKISINTHKKWVKKILKKKNDKIYVFYKIKRPVGTCMLIEKKEGFFLSYSIVKDLRRQGLSKKMFNFFNKKVINFKKKNLILADVLNKNTLSLKTLTKARFKIIEKNKKFTRMQLF